MSIHAVNQEGSLARCLFNEIVLRMQTAAPMGTRPRLCIPGCHTLGLTNIGSGNYGSCYEHPDLPGCVFKVATSKDAWPVYAAWCFRHQGMPGVPEMYRLDVSATAAVCCMKRYKPSSLHWSDAANYDDALRGFGPEAQHPTLFEIRKEFIRGAGWWNDLHKDNIMQDPDTGELVFTDPVHNSAGYGEYGKRVLKSCMGGEVTCSDGSLSAETESVSREVSAAFMRSSEKIGAEDLILLSKLELLRRLHEGEKDAGTAVAHRVNRIARRREAPREVLREGPIPNREPFNSGVLRVLLPVREERVLRRRTPPARGCVAAPEVRMPEPIAGVPACGPGVHGPAWGKPIGCNTARALLRGDFAANCNSAVWAAAYPERVYAVLG